MENTKATITFDLMDRLVWFWPQDGSSPVQAQVIKVWPDFGKIPGVNLKCLDNAMPSSVPHESCVSGASGYFWSATKKVNGMPEEGSL